MTLTRLLGGTLFLTLAGCNSHLPVTIQSPPERDLQYAQVKQEIPVYQDEIVRWGGKIVAVENREDSTWIEILANPLNSFGRPIHNRDYAGRFIARIDGYLDAEQYAKDRYITISGKVETGLVRLIDEYPYHYPLIHVQEYYLWPEAQMVHDYHWLYHYRPYYYPYYYPYSYHRRPFSRFHYGYHHDWY